MLSRVIRYLRGYLCIRVSGYSTERFLNACRYRGICLWGLEAVYGAYEMYMLADDFRKLRPVLRKTGVRVVILRRTGVPFLMHRYRKRKLFFAGALLSVVLVFGLSRFIWSIDIRGNLTRTDETILEFLSERSVKNGMLKTQVDCERIVKDIRKQYDDIIWVSASLQGTKLIIQVKENEDSLEVKNSGESSSSSGKAYDVVAERDCVIQKIIVRKGIPQTKTGEKVKKGQILVSGQVPVNDDSGEIIDYQYQEADADIIGETMIDYEDSCKNKYREKKKEGLPKEEYFLQLGKLRFVLGNVTCRCEHFEIYGEQGQLCIFENFSLPVYWGVRRVVPYTETQKTYSKKQIQQILTESFQRYCKDLEKKGVEIIRNDVKIYTGSEEAAAKGTLTVQMKVGKREPSELKKIPKSEEEEQTGDNLDGNDGSNH